MIELTDLTEPACPSCENTEGFYYVKRINEYYVMNSLPDENGKLSLNTRIHTGVDKISEPYLVCSKCSKRFNLELKEIDDE